VQLILAEEFKLHEFREEVGLSLPFLQSNESGSFPVEVGHSSCADGDVLTAGGVGKFDYLKVIWVVAFLEVAELVAQASFFFDQLNEIIGSQLFFEGLFSLL
jgi:hypothetical protein